jgi:hypothetical protein
MKDPYAPESETTALIKADTRTPAERELARLMVEAGDGEQGFEPEAALQRIALSLIAQLQDARTEVVALHATEQNLRDGIAPKEDRATPPAQPAPVQDEHQTFIDSLPKDSEDKMFMQIDYWARESYKRHQSSVRGQVVTGADGYESHVIWATLRWAKENTAAPVQEPRWYCIDKAGIATLCADEGDAKQSVKLAEQDWPRNAPYRAVRLCECAAPPKKDQS